MVKRLQRRHTGPVHSSSDVVTEGSCADVELDLSLALVAILAAVGAQEPKFWTMSCS